MNAGQLAPLFAEFAQNWAKRHPGLSLEVYGANINLGSNHPLHGEIRELCSGRSASLPFFPNASQVVWCTLAPDSDSLRQSVTALHSWVLPSFGGQGTGDGYIQPDANTIGLQAMIRSVSPDGYFRWHCPRSNLEKIIEKLKTQRRLEADRPPRTRPPRPSLYELRARFSASLLIGNREGAEKVIDLLDSCQLETAVNTQFMRIRMWHHFRELDRIREHPELPHLQAQPMPPRVRVWIDEAIGGQVVLTTVPMHVVPKVEITQILLAPVGWGEWFTFVKEGKRNLATLFLQDIPTSSDSDFDPAVIEILVSGLDDIYIEESLRNRERGVILEGISEILERYIREPQFPRPALGKLYLALLHLWGSLHAGNSAGQEHGHVLLEIASAVLRLNLELESVLKTVEGWWKAKPVPSQLPFALDAIELLERELPKPEATLGLWVEAASVMKRSPDVLPLADRQLYRDAGERLGIDSDTITEYLPPEVAPHEGEDPLSAARLGHIAIVCLREKQASQAAEAIRERSNFKSKVTVVTATTACAETTLACQADVVLYVWSASTHAVFRAFDAYDRKRFCYVQGTGSSSIVKALERWLVDA